MKMKKVLIIDDEARIRFIIQALFRKEHYAFEMAEDGEDGLRRAEADPPDLVIVDLLLPRMHGFEVISRLKANPATAHIPILVLSAKVYAPDQRKALGLGASVFVEKPFNVEELFTAVQSQLSKAA